MTEPVEVADDVEPPTAIEYAQTQGMPTDVRHCPVCGEDQTVRQLVDFPDEGYTQKRPYGCLTCGSEFAAISEPS